MDIEKIDSLKPYIKNFYKGISKTVGIKGDVLIVGGLEVESLACLALGANRVIICNPWFSLEKYKVIIDNFNNDRVIFHCCKAEDLDLQNSTIDRVFSSCVIEHITNVQAVLETIYSIMKPGGIAVINGGPVWTSPKGHHLWVKGKNSNIRYFFNGLGDALPINDWEHLIYNSSELKEILIKRGTPIEDAETIIDYIYLSNDLNRFSPTQIGKFIMESNFNCLGFKCIPEKVPDENILNKLKNTYSIRDLSAGSINITLLKPDF